MSTCVSSLADANIAMLRNAVIELCPGTYPIGTPFDSAFTSFVGGIPLIVDQSGVTVKCGADGASSNGCIFEGGWTHILLNAGADNLNVSGITFTGQMESALSGTYVPRVIYAPVGASQTTFNDCVFSNINTTGYVMDFRPATTDTGSVNVTNTVFTDISHSFDVISANANTLIQFTSVSFNNMSHTLPEAGVEACKGLTQATCKYASSIIHVGNTALATTNLSDSYVGVSVSNSEFYTSILRTAGDWHPKNAAPVNFTTLVTSTNNTIYNQTGRTANDDYCEGGYAAAYNTSTLIDWTCRRVDYSWVPVAEMLTCGYDCDMNGNFSTLLGALETSGLLSQLATNTNNVTIFAPTNAAFGQLPPGFLDGLVANDTATLRSLLLYHVTLEDPVDTAAIAAGLPAAETVQGESVSFTPKTATADYYKVDLAKFIQTDWEETPGGGKIVQVIDRVIYPSTIPILPSFSQLVETLNLTQFTAAAAQVGFDPNLENNGTYTLFAPSDAAIQNSAVAQALLNSNDKAQLTKLLNHHFVLGNYNIASLQSQSCQDLKSLAELNIKITYSSASGILWNDAFTNTSVVDQLTYNGIVHVVDGLMGIQDADIKTCAVSGAASGRGVGSVAMSSVAISMVGTILAMLMF